MPEQRKRDQGCWVAVDDRLPLPYVDVLVALHSPEGLIGDLGYRNRKGVWFYADIQREKILASVAYWHPLPDPPRRG